MGITVDVAARSMNKYGEILCGDTVEMLKTPDSVKTSFTACKDLSCR